MSEHRQDLPSKLAKARQKLQKAQADVADLEAQLFAEQSNPISSLSEIPTQTLKLTEHQQEAEVARKSDERFRLLAEEVSDYAIYLLDATGLVTSWNTGAE